ncbi:transcriptional repressor rco-1 [Coccidioides immitis RMSCC 3703]|uniref:Transcriptional repressor rco-1 n=1 Tax=Coccidioides immitis RMSCC 3703 TaxID=454286 RepID=A0A0J8R496_COCIT|nr:transcriptional repressor rco-1 [Coccidioides immitis RMSCC 3703]
MYNRAMVPAPNPRLTELFDQLRQEYENQSRSHGECEHQLTGQLQEMEMIRQRVTQLEQAHIDMKQKYEAEIRGLRMELESRGIHLPPSHVGGPPTHGGLSQAPPPALGHGPSNLFGGIIANQGGGPPALAPPPPQDQQQPPQHSLQPPASGAQGPPQPQQGAFGGYQPNSAVNGYGPPPPAPTSSPGPGKGRANRAPPGPATPQQNQPVAYADPRESPQIPQPTPGQPIPYRVGNASGNWNPTSSLQPKRKKALIGCNRSAQIFDVASGQLVTTLQDDTANKEGDLYIRSVCFSPDGKFLATGAEDRQIRVWDIANRKIRHIFAGHENDIYSLDYSRNGRYIASGSGDKTVRMWDVYDGKQELILSIEDGVTTVAISPDGRYVAAGSLDRSVRVWDTTTGYLVERLESPDGHRDSVYSVAFAPNGRDLVSGSLDKTIKMWELTPPRGIMAGSGPKGWQDFVLSVCFTPDGHWVLSGSKDRGVQFCDVMTGHAQMMLQGHRNSVISVAPSPTGQLFATGSGDCRAKIWSYGPWGRR